MMPAPDIPTLTSELSRLVQAAAPGAEERHEAKHRVYHFRASRQFCRVWPVTAHVTLGFDRGAALDDPAGVLQGAGTSVRHIKITLLNVDLRSALTALIRQAHGHARS